MFAYSTLRLLIHYIFSHGLYQRWKSCLGKEYWVKSTDIEKSEATRIVT